MLSTQKNELRTQLNTLNNRIDSAIEEFDSNARQQGIDPNKMVTPHGEITIALLLLAKAEVLSSIVNLSTEGKVK